MFSCCSAPRVKQGKVLSSKMVKAIQGGDVDAVRKRLKSGDDVNAPPGFTGGLTALTISVFHGHEKVLKVLAKAGGRLDQQEDDNGMTPLMIAALNN